MRLTSKCLEEQIQELAERLDHVEAEVRKLKITPRKLIEARAWVLIYEIKYRQPVNNIISMDTYQCADFFENGIDDELLTMPNAINLLSNVRQIMELAAKLDPEIFTEKTGPIGKKVIRLIYRPKKDTYTFKDLLRDYS
jgi:hypothetical protein